MTIQVGPIGESPSADEALEKLLHESYVGGGFTNAELASSMFCARAVRSRGTVCIAVAENGSAVGTLTLVAPGSPASQLATDDEAEFHLLCVRPSMRGRGVGSALVEWALAEAVKLGAHGVVLWTQPTMVPAQRLYEQSGFRRDSGADFSKQGRDFLVYRRALTDLSGRRE